MPARSLSRDLQVGPLQRELVLRLLRAPAFTRQLAGVKQLRDLLVQTFFRDRLPASIEARGQEGGQAKSRAARAGGTACTDAAQRASYMLYKCHSLRLLARSCQAGLLVPASSSPTAIFAPLAGADRVARAARGGAAGAQVESASGPVRGAGAALLPLTCARRRCCLAAAQPCAHLAGVACRA